MAESFLVIEGSMKKLPIMFSSFPDGDTHCVVENVPECKNKSVLLFHRLYPDQNTRIIQLLLAIDVLREHGAKTISVFVPYLPYCRQDKRHIPGESISSDALCRMISTSGCKNLYTLDCHFMKEKLTEKRGGLTLHNVSLGNELIAAYTEQTGHDKFDIVGPDKGSSYLTADHGGKHMLKTRGNYKELGKEVSYRQIESLVGDHIDHTHDHVLIIDDMISTGSTIIKATQQLRAKGISSVACATTHGFFLKGSYSLLDELCDGLIYSDSIEQPNAAIKSLDVFEQQIVPHWQKKG